MTAAADDARSLRRCLQDFAALFARPAWSGGSPSGIAESLADSLLDMLDARFVHVRIRQAPDEAPLEIARTTEGPATLDRAREIGRAVTPALPLDAAARPLGIRSPVGGGTVWLAVVPIEANAARGALAAGAGRREFPTETERLLLTAAASLAAVALAGHGARLDLIERERVEARLAAEHAVTRALAESDTLARATPRILEAVCEHLGWDAGAIWHVDRRAGAIRCAELWHRPSVRLEEFEADSRSAAFPIGVGLPGRVWASSTAVWVPDVLRDTNFPRAASAATAGLHAALAFPVILHGQVLAVIEFFSHEIRQPDEDLLQLMQAIGSQIGQFLERHRTEQALGHEQELLHRIIDAIPVMITLYDPATNVVRLNREFTRLVGWSTQDVAGVSLMEQCYPDPGYRETVRRFMRECRDGWMDIRMTTRSGREIETSWANIQLSYDVQVGIGIDITERKRTENVLRLMSAAGEVLASSIDYQATLENVARLPVPVLADGCLLDLGEPGGRLRRVAMHHADPGMLGRVEEMGYRHPGHSSHAESPEAVLRTGEPVLVPDVTAALLASFADDGGHRELIRRLDVRSYMCVPLQARGQTMGVLTLLSSESRRSFGEGDLRTAQELARRAALAIDNARLYDELRKTDRRKDEFLATLAHELRNPLAPMRNALDILETSPDEARRVAQARGVIERQLRQMVRLVDDLLDVSRIATGKILLRPERIDLRMAVESALEASLPLIRQRDHQLTVTIAPEPIYVNADLTRLAQIVLNLLDNAARYTEPGGHVRLAVERQGDEAVIQVEDNGIGIPADLLPEVFEMFMQVNRRLEDTDRGLGIGLSLARKLTQLHGGFLTARSEGVGRGSEFVVRLPCLAEPASPEPPAPRLEEDKPAAAAKRRILVVEDNSDSAEALSMMLQLAGNEVRTAHDGLEALDAAEAFRPEVIVLDVGLPKLNGYEVAIGIRKQPWGKEVVLIALTGWGQAEDKRRAAEAGFDHHLVKPVEPKALRALLSGTPSRGPTTPDSNPSSPADAS
jgi:PAS domain S-box-containing protein